MAPKAICSLSGQNRLVRVVLEVQQLQRADVDDWLPFVGELARTAKGVEDVAGSFESLSWSY